MSLLKAFNYGSWADPSSSMASGSAWLELSSDWESHHAVVAANINILRREVPFAYFFANEPLDEYIDESDTVTMEYVRSMDVIECSRGVWMVYPSFEGPTKTSVRAVLQGDILPFVHALSAEEFALLCLPSPRDLTSIKEIVDSAPTNEQAVLKLISDGGCIISVIDDVNFSVRTMSPSLMRYFQRSGDG